MATFTGTLLRREHKPGQKFVQLVFREQDKNWLCISSKLTNIKLIIGQSYRIQGIFKKVGEREYIQEPNIVLAKRHVPVKRLVIAGSIILVFGLAGGVAFAAHHSMVSPQVMPVAKHVAVPAATESSTAETPVAAAQPAPVTPTPVATPVVKTAAKTTPKTTVTPPVVTPPTTTDTPQAPVPDPPVVDPVPVDSGTGSSGTGTGDTGGDTGDTGSSDTPVVPPASETPQT